MTQPQGTTIVGADHGEQSVQDVILGLLDEDTKLEAEVKSVILDALAEVDGTSTADEETGYAATFLTSIEVGGFRGIGPKTRLELYPAPGLMVVSGRNGSGKSSFAEALELTLTGSSYRWRKKSSLWAETWRNLHQPVPCQIRVGFTADGVDPFTVGLDWKADDGLADCTRWTQIGSGKRAEGTDALGWTRPLELYRPVLSYDELGRLFDGGPSELYDALAKLLGLEVLADTEKWLTTTLKDTKATRGRADDERRQLRAALADVADERAQRAATLLNKRPVPVDDVLALATGADDGQVQVVPALRALTRLDVPSIADIEVAVTGLRSAAQQMADTATDVIELTAQRVGVLQAALSFHDHAGETDCPVCGQGRLDNDWAVQARDSIAEAREVLQQYRSATTVLNAARTTATGLLTGLGPVGQIAGVELAGLTVFNDAVEVAKQAPADDGALAAHLETALTNVVAAAETLSAQATDELARREDLWAPIAAQLGGWVKLELEARELDPRVKTLTAAKIWVAGNSADFRNRRLEPIAARAREIWGELRQESNVELGQITLTGTGNQRKAVLDGSVDGEPTAALPVMSQGELHAVALALFLPRASALKSPFRFVVLDDPIQAMDPAKIDGFIRVLIDLARTHQVVVFSHDDRLASALRQTGADARLVDVVRETGSRVSVRENRNPALRHVADVKALMKDEQISDDIKLRVVPGLFRMALESAIRQAYFAKSARAGTPQPKVETAWASAKKTSSKLALLIHGSDTADVSDWLDKRHGRRKVLAIGNKVHQGADFAVSEDDAAVLEGVVLEVLALR